MAATVTAVMGVAASCESCPVSGSGSQLSTGVGATLEGESEGWELLGVELPWKVRVRVGNYWGWGYPGR